MNLLPIGKIDRVLEGLLAGRSIRQVVAEVGVAKDTVMRYRRIMLADPEAAFQFVREQREKAK